MIVARKLTQRYSRASHARERASNSGSGADSVLTVLDGVDLEIREAEVVVILGPSGSGKTTLLGLLAGLDRPSEGSVRLAGIELETLDEEGRATMRAERIGFIFQSFHLIPTLTAVENVLVPLELLPPSRALRPAEAIETARMLLDRVGLAGRLDHYPAQLSGGEQQRVSIARGLVKNPPLMLADEPTGALDTDTGTQVLSLLREITDAGDRTIVVVTHNGQIAQIANRVIELRDGEIIDDAVVADPRDPADVAW